jgi:predicted RNase H-like HicB family nuclease
MIIYLRNHAKSYTVRVTEEKDDGGFSGQCVELPEAISKGKTLEELRQNMKEAIELVLEEGSTAEPGRSPHS